MRHAQAVDYELTLDAIGIYVGTTWLHEIVIRIYELSVGSTSVQILSQRYSLVEAESPKCTAGC